MNNLLSYFGLTDARIRASEKDLPVCRARGQLQNLVFRHGAKDIYKKFNFTQYPLHLIKGDQKSIGHLVFGYEMK